jgi:hypothetical protein
MDASEQLSMPHHPEVFERGQRVDYYNAKRLNEFQKTGANIGELMKEHKALMMTNSRHYGNVGINTSVSAVHVPTNVFDGGTVNHFLIYESNFKIEFLNVRTGRDERDSLVGAIGQNLHF